MDHQAISIFNLRRHEAPTEMFAPPPPSNARPSLENGTKHEVGGEISGSRTREKIPSQGIVTDSSLLDTNFLKGDGSAALGCCVEETAPIGSPKDLMNREEKPSTDGPSPDSSSPKFTLMVPSMENSPTKFEPHGDGDKVLIEEEEMNVLLLPGDEDCAIGCQAADTIANWPMAGTLVPDSTREQERH